MATENIFPHLLDRTHNSGYRFAEILARYLSHEEQFQDVRDLLPRLTQFETINFTPQKNVRLAVIFALGNNHDYMIIVGPRNTDEQKPTRMVSIWKYHKEGPLDNIQKLNASHIFDPDEGGSDLYTERSMTVLHGKECNGFTYRQITKIFAVVGH